MILNSPLRSAAIAALLASVLVVGCGRPDATESLAAGKAHIAKSDYKTAIVELKNSLQSNADSAEARFLLGHTLLELGDAFAASIELRKALDLKFSADEVVPLLARAYVLAGEARKALELDSSAALSMPAAVASLKTQVAYAHAAAGKRDMAEAALALALQADPSSVPGLTLRARWMGGAGDLVGALRIIDEVLARAPRDIDARMAKADLLGATGDHAGAAAVYRSVLQDRPYQTAAHAALIEWALADRKIDEARTQVAALKKERPQHPTTKYFEGRVALQSGDANAAWEFSQQLLKMTPGSPQALLLAGVASMQRGDRAVAEQHLTKLVQLAPGLVAGRQMLARLHLAKGQPANALEMLRPMLQAPSPDSESLSLAGTAYMQTGEPRKAEDFFKRAVESGADNVRNRTALAAARIGRGDVNAGLGELEALARSDPGATADLALIAANLTRRNFDDALQAVDRLEAKLPASAQAPQLRGQILASRGDVAGARKAFEKALIAVPGFYPSVEGLAALDMRDGKLDQARARFETALKANPNEARAIAGLAVLDERAGKPKQEVAAMLAKAIAAKRDDAGLRRQLIQYHMRKQDYKIALAAAQDAVAALPNDADMLALLAGAQLASGEANQAMSTYNKLVAARPKSPEPLIGLAEAQLVAKSYDAAADAANRALVLAPDSPAVVRTAAKVDIRAGRYDQALSRARGLQIKAPKGAEGWILEGDVELARRNWPAAVTALRTALQKQEETPTAQRLHQALRNSGDKAKADAFGVDWLKKHPEDPAFLLYMAGWAIEEKEFERAATQLEEVLRKSPDSPLALNNLAWVQATLKRPGAVAAAERVNELRPNQPMFMDTLAYALAAEGKIARAVDVQKKALELAPSANVLRLNMARLYVQAGDKAAARAELDTLAKLGDRFARQNEVRELQAKL